MMMVPDGRGGWTRDPFELSHPLSGRPPTPPLAGSGDAPRSSINPMYGPNGGIRFGGIFGDAGISGGRNYGDPYQQPWSRPRPPRPPPMAFPGAGGNPMQGTPHLRYGGYGMPFRGMASPDRPPRQVYGGGMGASPYGGLPNYGGGQSSGFWRNPADPRSWGTGGGVSW